MQALDLRVRTRTSSPTGDLTATRRRTSMRVLVGFVAGALIALGTVVPAAADTTAPGPDPDFTTNIGSGPATTATAAAVQSDGRMLVGGNFTSFNGAAVNRLVRLNADGTRDTAFSMALGSGPNASVASIAVQSDGKILLAGSFTTVNGVTANRLARLNTDGSLDTVFATAIGTGLNSNANALLVQPDGKILVSGTFATFNGVTVNRLVRLNADGSRDTGFTTALGSGFNSNASTLALQPDGKILVGGLFTTVNGVTSNRLARLNASGTVDTAFTSGLGSGFNLTTSSLALQSDGKILVGGSFNTLNGGALDQLARLNADGTPDTAFNTNLGTASDTSAVTAILPQPDGKILLGGGFLSFNGTTIAGVYRLNADGTGDGAYNSSLGTGLRFSVSQLHPLADGSVLATGAFASFNGVPVARVTKIVPIAVTVAPIPDQTDRIGDAVSLAVAAATTGTPISYAASGLPAGLSIDPATGLITGSPTTLGTSTVVVTVSSSTVTDSTTNFTWAIEPALASPAITSAPLPDATLGTDYSFTVTATGNPAPTFSITAGALPDGLLLDSTTGQITGTPAASGPFPLTITATNTEGSDAQSLTLEVNAPPAIMSPPPTAGVVGRPFAYTVTATGYPAPMFAVTAGALPQGLSLDSATGIISGIPQAAGSFPLTITASNASGTASRDYTIAVAAAAAATPPSAPGEVPADRGALPATGASAPVGALISGMLLVLLGTVAIGLRRRRESARA